MLVIIEVHFLYLCENSFSFREDWKPVLTINSIVYGLQYLFLVSQPRVKFHCHSMHIQAILLPFFFRDKNCRFGVFINHIDDLSFASVC